MGKNIKQLYIVTIILLLIFSVTTSSFARKSHRSRKSSTKNSVLKSSSKVTSKRSSKHTMEVASLPNSDNKNVKKQTETLSSIKSEIDKHNAELNKIAEKSKTIKKRIEITENFIKKNEQDKAVYDHNLKVADRKIELVNKKITSLEQSIKSKSNDLIGNVKVVFNSKIVASAVPASSKNDAASSTLNATTLNEIKSLAEDKEDLLKEKNRLENYKQKVLDYKSTADKNIELAENRKNDRAKIFDDVNKEKEKRLAEVSKLMEQQSNLEKTINTLTQASLSKKSLRKKAVVINEEDLNTNTSRFYNTAPQNDTPAADNAVDTRIASSESNPRYVLRNNSSYTAVNDPNEKAPVSSNGRPWPVSGGKSSIYQCVRTYNETPPHIDFSVPEDSPVYASEDGTVIFANFFAGYDNLIIIEHESGYVSLYAFTKSILVNVGQQISKGSKIATAGYLESKTVPGIRFEIRKNNRAINPMLWFSRG